MHAKQTQKEKKRRDVYKAFSSRYKLVLLQTSCQECFFRSAVPLVNSVSYTWQSFVLLCSEIYFTKSWH